MKRNVTIDIFRLISAYMVVIYHVRNLIENPLARTFASKGYLGLFIFFFISSYLIYDKYSSIDKLKIERKKFYIKRFFRIFPTWWFFCSLFFILQYKNVSLLKYALNMTMTFGFFDLPGINFTTVGWTLFAEEVFYLCSPLFFILFRSNILGTVIFLSMWILSHFLYLWLGKEEIESLSILHTFTVIHFFFLGILSRKLVMGTYLKILHYKLLLCASIVAIIITQLQGVLIDQAFLFAAFAIFLFFEKSQIKYNVLIEKISHIGKYSYSIYLSHLLVYSAIDLLELNLPLTVNLYLGLGLTTLGAFLSYNIIEKPTQMLGASLANRISTIEPDIEHKH